MLRNVLNLKPLNQTIATCVSRRIGQKAGKGWNIAASGFGGATNSETKPPGSSRFYLGNQKVSHGRRGWMTVPNLLTYSRLASSPAIGYLIWNEMHIPALLCFSIAAATDLLDGLIARTFNQESDIGTIMDPIADKALIMSSIAALYHVDLVPVYLVKMIILKDVSLLCAGAVIRYYAFGDKKISVKDYFDLKKYPILGFDPTLFSKFSTGLQCIIIPLTLALATDLVTIPYQSITMTGLYVTTTLTAMGAMSQYIFRLQAPRSIVPRSKS